VIGALADAGLRFARPEWVDAAASAADAVLALHGEGPELARASLGGRRSSAPATLEDLGGLAGGLLRLALATGSVRYATIARTLVEACRTPGGGIAAPAGSDPVLAAHGLATETDPSDGALPSGRSLLADAALLLAALTGDAAHRRIAEDALAPALGVAAAQPSAFGGALAAASALVEPLEQLVIVAEPGEEAALVAAVADWHRGVLAVAGPDRARELADAGFELFAGRGLRDGEPAAYYCERFVCALPVSSPDALRTLVGLG